MTVAGTYSLYTQYNLLSILPDSVTTTFNKVLEFATNPGKFVMDMAGNLSVIKYVIDVLNIFGGIGTSIENAINSYVESYAIGLPDGMSLVAQSLEDALRGMQAKNRLEVSTPAADGTVQVTDTLYELDFPSSGIEYPTPQNLTSTVQCTMTGFRLSVPAHTYNGSVKIGTLLDSVLDNIVLTQLTGVNSLGALLNQLMSCDDIGYWVWDVIGNICLGDTCIGDDIGPDDISKLCQNALAGIGNLVEDGIKALDSPLPLATGDGSAILGSSSGGASANVIRSGTWSLGLPIGSTQITLPGSFVGATGY
jgi:hypothetical protein